MEKSIPQSLDTTKVERKTEWVSLLQGWYLGATPAGFILICQTNGLTPDDPRSSASKCQLTMKDFAEGCEKLADAYHAATGEGMT